MLEAISQVLQRFLSDPYACHGWRDSEFDRRKRFRAAEKVEGNSGRNSATVTESSLTSGSTSTLWADIPLDLDEPLDFLPMPQWDQDEESADIESRKVVQVSERTQKAIKTAFGKPLHNAARLQTRKAYPFPMTEDTKCPKLDIFGCLLILRPI